MDNFDPAVITKLLVGYGLKQQDGQGRSPLVTYISLRMMNKPKAMANVPPHWLIYFRVPDVDAAAERIKANGGKVLNGPMEVPGGDRVVTAADPQGAAFGLHAKKA